MEIQELVKLAEGGYITDSTIISYYREHEDELTPLSGEDLANMGYITDISLAVEIISEHPDQVTFEIKATPEDATITINDAEENPITVEYGTEVSWNVTKEGYEEQSGTETITKNTVKNIELVPSAGVTGPDGTLYESAQDAIDAGVSEITLYSDVDSLNVAAGSSLTIHGNGKTFNGMFRPTPNDLEGKPEYNINIDGLKFMGTGSEEGAMLIQDQKSAHPAGMNLVLDGCTFENYTQKKCIYFTNAKNVEIKNCKFINCKAADYIIDFNQCATTDANISITDNIFETDEGNKPVQSYINIKQRGGEDDLAKDLFNGTKIWDTESSEFVENPEGTASTIASCNITGNTFPDVEGPVDIIFGDNNNEDGSIRKYSGNFRTNVTGEGTTVYQKWLGEIGEHTVTVGPEPFTNTEE